MLFDTQVNNKYCTTGNTGNERCKTKQNKEIKAVVVCGRWQINVTDL